MILGGSPGLKLLSPALWVEESLHPRILKRACGEGSPGAGAGLDSWSEQVPVPTERLPG